MFERIFKKLYLSEKGMKDLKVAIYACVVSNFTLLIPFIVLMQIIQTLIDPLTTGLPLDTGRLWLLFAAGAVADVIYYVVYRNEYDKTYVASYKECEVIRVDVAERMRQLPLSFFNQKDLSELTTNMMGDCNTIEHAMSHIVPAAAANVITITFTCVMLALYDWRMALAIFCTLPVAFGILWLSKGAERKYGERHVRAKLDVSGQVQEYLDGIKVVKAFGLHGEKSTALERSLRTMMKEAIVFEVIVGCFVTLGTVILRMGTGIVVLVGVNLLTGGTLGVIPFITFLMISVRIYGPLTTVMTLLPEFFYLMISAERMQKLRREPIMIGDETITLPDVNIAFEHVSFAYNEDTVIHDMSFTIPQDGVTAFVGPSGSGKSTLSQLIARFWDVKSGRITIGGVDISTVDPEHLMGYMSFVFQDVVLFNDTVYNNIRIGDQSASREQVIEAAKMARCHDFIEAMPQGYDTLIGENGCTLSGGERQRISIARALLKNAPIVLLDEATASLDPENEVLIQAAISELVRGRTVIVIAHRLRTVAGADQILVLDNGHIVEQGTGDELLQQDGLYAHLWGIQQQSLGWSVGS